MQVDFDSTYLEEDVESQRKIKLRNKMISTHKQAILDVKMEDAQDYEALTTLYRKVFRFLLEFAPNTKASDKTVEREIAAALESVFPRVGLKSFIQLGSEEKIVQLLELARIVLGIRLFNREEGRGGVGIDNLDKDGSLLAKMLLQDIEKEIEFFNDACHKYQIAIVKAHSYRRKKKHLNDELESKRREADEVGDGKAGNNPSHRHGLKNELFLISQLEDVNDYVIERWSQELANRRQYLGFLNSLYDEMKFIHSKVNSIIEKVKLELATVKSLVNNKASVPKEAIYPKFDALGTLWLQLYEEIVVMIARSNTFQVLCKYRLSFSPTLANELVGDDVVNNEYELSLKESHHKAVHRDDYSGKASMENSDFDDDMKAFGEEEKDNAFVKQSAIAESKISTENEKFVEMVESGAQLLTVENSPDFSLLPLSLQGYCPWTIVEANGLLIPGKPALGIVRFENQYFVFDHALGIRSFMQNPQHFLSCIRNRALRHPEYIHLLRLQKWFPTVSISKLLQSKDVNINNQTGQPFTKDVGTETPLHFQDSYIDLNYHWNEWELRRRALKIVNLKNCKTKGQQTDVSHFRRENETQVFIPKENSSQTKSEKGTNPPIVTTYIQGFRGRVLISDEKDSSLTSTKSESKDFRPRKIAYPKVGVVKLTLDL